MSDYWKKSYLTYVRKGHNMLIVSKSNGDDWVDIGTESDDVPRVDMTIYGKEMVEQLHFMLGQLLGK